MRKFIHLLLAIAPIVFVCRVAHSEGTNCTLAFYVVSDVKIEGGRLIDTPNMPKLGYIAGKPDLTVTNLQAVFPDENTTIVIGPGKDGTSNPFRRVIYRDTWLLDFDLMTLSHSWL